MSSLHLDVIGTPTPQGSKRGFVVNGRAVIVDDNKRPLKTWRQDVRAAALNAIADTGWAKLDGPTIVLITFYLPRPRSHYRTGRNSHLLRDAAPAYPATKPDLDKLERAVLDALGEAGVWTDDSRVVMLGGSKQYADDARRQPGATIQVSPTNGATDLAAASLNSTPSGAAAALPEEQGVLL